MAYPLIPSVLLTTNFQTIYAQSARLEFVSLNNTHSADVTVTIADGRGYPVFSEAITTGRATDLRYPSLLFAGGVQMKASVAGVVYAWPVLQDA